MGSFSAFSSGSGSHPPHPDYHPHCLLRHRMIPARFHSPPFLIYRHLPHRSRPLPPGWYYLPPNRTLQNFQFHCPNQQNYFSYYSGSDPYSAPHMYSPSSPTAFLPQAGKKSANHKAYLWFCPSLFPSLPPSYLFSSYQYPFSVYHKLAATPYKAITALQFQYFTEPSYQPAGTRHVIPHPRIKVQCLFRHKNPLPG